MHQGYVGLPRWGSAEESACWRGDPGDSGSIPGFGRIFGEGNGNPLQYSSLENSMDREAWQATIRGIAELGTTEHTQRQGYVTDRQGF